MTCGGCRANWCWLCGRVMSDPSEHYSETNIFGCPGAQFSSAWDSPCCRNCSCMGLRHVTLVVLVLTRAVMFLYILCALILAFVCSLALFVPLFVIMLVIIFIRYYILGRGRFPGPPAEYIIPPLIPGAALGVFIAALALIAVDLVLLSLVFIIFVLGNVYERSMHSCRDVRVNSCRDFCDILVDEYIKPTSLTLQVVRFIEGMMAEDD